MIGCNESKGVSKLRRETKNKKAQSYRIVMVSLFSVCCLSERARERASVLMD